jgi:uncharacterized protein YbgA (DUF1722 family)
MKKGCTAWNESPNEERQRRIMNEYKNDPIRKKILEESAKHIYKERVSGLIDLEGHFEFKISNNERYQKLLDLLQQYDELFYGIKTPTP